MFSANERGSGIFASRLPVKWAVTYLIFVSQSKILEKNSNNQKGVLHASLKQNAAYLHGKKIVQARMNG